ncbi:endonuclease YncB(thermonuclease family) [Oceanisphaera litoralis]|uniref:thermonuclease family protein n=1 Tax=Oceanisphaera litoralis TaxID=225144 RepID=UPI001958EFA9|nr:thermonuclease family protein [Oceanisphaera litoralis]MBM7456270.1 endonuclease YncB(thermonuclease family) [Oceanisphaera litoralis]
MKRWQWLLIMGLWSLPVAAECPRPPADETVTVRHIVDGDTVILQDGRVIRFIGIDTPEFNKHSKLPAESGAEAARRWLLNKIPKGSRLKLVFGVERRDDYGRWLAHPLTTDGNLLVTRMLAQGLGPLLLIPPNDDYWRCWLAAEQQARQRRLGVWQASLTRFSSGGWQLLQARVVLPYAGSGRLKIELEGQLTVMAGKHLPATARHSLKRLRRGDRLFIRGRVHASPSGRQRGQERGRQIVWINHPWQFYQVEQ